MTRKIKSGLSAASKLGGYRAELSKCVKCGSCRAVCPSFLETREESFSARGRMALVQAVLEGRIQASGIYKDRLRTCTTCLACEAACASSVPVTDIIQAAKELAVTATGTSFQDRIIATVLGNNRLMRSGARFAFLALHYRSRSVKGGVSNTKGKHPGTRRQGEKKPKRGKILFFPGCAITHFQPDIGISTVTVLRKLGYEVIVPSGLQCCGRPLLSLGDNIAAEKAASINRGIFMHERPDAIVTACASCGLTFKKEYPTVLSPGDPLPAFVDIHEILANDLSKLHYAPLNRAITWHDPCHLSRGQGLGNRARQILKGLPGVTFLEMKDADRCCGFGGVMRVTHRGLSNSIGDEKAKNIVATGAEAVVTGCPSCRMQIAEGLIRAGSSAEVLHTVQLIEEALANAE